MSAHAVLLLESPIAERERLVARFAERGLAAHLDAARAPLAAVEALVTVTQRVDAELLARVPACRCVAVSFTGCDHVDLEACRARGIAVCNVPEYATTATAELAVALSLALLRGIPRADRRLHALEWRPEPGRELRARTVGIVGTGRIGCEAARLFRAFGCEVLGWSRRPSARFAELGGRHCATLDELLAASDLVSLHLPLTRETRGILGARELALFQPGARLVNVARGALVDAVALHAALRGGQLAGAALDVFETEPFAGVPPFHELDNVVLAPHLGFRTAEALARRFETTLENLVAFFDGRAQNLVR